MKTYRKINSIFVLGLAMGGPAFTAHAAETSGMLIEKLVKIQSNMQSTDSSYVNVTLRLADLLSEKARLLSNAEIAQGCSPCLSGMKERELALKNYSLVENKLSAQQKAKVLVQKGHLYTLNLKNDLAIKSYQSAADLAAGLENASEILAEGYLGIAEIYFKERDFKSAKKYYQQIIGIKQKVGSANHAAYRSAWCSLNMKELEQGLTELKQILTSQDLTKVLADSDQQYFEEVSRDYSTFLAQKNFTDEDLKFLEQNSIKNKNENLLNVAYESQRIGKPENSIKAFNYVYENVQNVAEKINLLSYRSFAKWGLGQKSESLQDFEQALALWKQNGGCGAEKCEELQKLLRKHVVDWSKQEKLKPSNELILGYQAYLKTFPADLEMSLWVGQILREQKKFQDADGFLMMALKFFRGDDNQLENLLLTRIENAEESGEVLLKQGAYEGYLQRSLKRTKQHEIQYQALHLSYENESTVAGANQTGQSSTTTAGANLAESFKAYAETKEAPLKLRKQAADLALDLLAQTKQNDLIGLWSGQFASVFPEQKQEFQKIQQKSQLTKSVDTAQANYASSWEILTSIKPELLDESDRSVWLKNKLIVAENLKKWPEVSSIANEVLALKDITASEREKALSLKAWVSELQFDFKTALVASEKMQMKELTADQKLLKLGSFAELAGEKNAYYNQFLNNSKDDSLKAAVAAEIVRKSKTPWVDLNKYKKVISTDLNTWTALNLNILQASEAFDKDFPTAVNNVLKNTEAQKTSGGILLWRVDQARKISAMAKDIADMKLETQNQNKLAQSIKKRAAKLKAADALANEAISMGVWTTQVATLGLVSKENQRFYDELMSAPMPAGLNDDEQNEYLQLLTAQAAPFQQKAEQTKNKLKEFLSQEDKAKEEIGKSLDGEYRKLVQRELNELSQSMPAESMITTLATSLGRDVAANGQELKLVSGEQVEQLKEKIKQQPENVSLLKELQEMERQRKNFAMVGYLENRISRVQQLNQNKTSTDEVGKPKEN